MEIDIKPINKKYRSYRGSDRLLEPSDFYIKRNRGANNNLIKMYLEYNAFSEEIDLVEMEFEKIYPFYRMLTAYQVPCEMILIDESPVEVFAGKELELLGLDILNEVGETLLFDTWAETDDALINKNGLCINKEDCMKVLARSKDLILEEEEYQIYYVYKICC